MWENRQTLLELVIRTSFLALKLSPYMCASKGVTMSALLVKACAMALAQHPVIYAAVTPDGSGVNYADHINVAVAVAMPGERPRLCLYLSFCLYF